MDALAKYGRLRVIPGSTEKPAKPRTAQPDEGSEQRGAGAGWPLRVLPTRHGGFRPYALVVSSARAAPHGAVRALASPKRPAPHGIAPVKGARCDPGQAAAGTGCGGLRLPFQVVAEFPGLPAKVVGVSHGCQEDLVAVSESGERLLALTAQASGPDTLAIWVIVKGGGRGAPRGTVTGGSDGSSGQVVWVGMALSLSNVVTNVHMCPQWGPKCLVPSAQAGRAAGRALGEEPPPVWMRLQIRDAPGGEGGIIWRGGWRNVKGWVEDAIARPQHGSWQPVTYSPQRNHGRPLCEGPLQVRLAQDGCALLAGDVIFDGVVWLDVAVGLCGPGGPGAEKADEWWLASTCPAQDDAMAATELLWQRSALCPLEYDAPSQPEWDDGRGGNGGRGSRAPPASHARLRLQHVLQPPPPSAAGGDARHLQPDRPWSAAAIHLPGARRPKEEQRTTEPSHLACELVVELEAADGASGSTLWRVESVRCSIPRKSA
jgi:hypothetical protein